MEYLGYHRLGEEADGDSFQTDERIDEISMRKYNTFSLRSFLAGTAFGFILFFLALTMTPIKPNNSCTRLMSNWSPALEVFDDNDLSIQRFNGALRDGNRFRGSPSQAIDDAWEEITYLKGGLVRLEKNQLDKVNASAYAAAYTEEMGGGFMAGIEVFHQIHCVNMLRQATYMDYYLPRNEEWKDRATLRYHLDHCIDMLRQKLMCDADVGMVTYVWAKGYKQAFPDFNTVHKCRRFSKVLDWAHTNYVHGRNVSDIERAPGALERDTRP